MTKIDDWYLENLVCPLDKTKLNLVGNNLVSKSGNTYPIIDGIPIMLLNNVQQTIEIAKNSLAVSNFPNYTNDPYFVNTLGITENQKQELREYIGSEEIMSFAVDPIVQFLVAATNGILYSENRGNLKRLPIPDIRLPMGNGKHLLDIGCSWGRWCIAATYKNYKCVGLDPSLGAVLAGKRIADKLGININFVVGDARYLPFNSSAFNQVFSYSVIQHFSKSDAK